MNECYILSFGCVPKQAKDYCFHWPQLFLITQMIVVECKESEEYGINVISISLKTETQ